jgi:hypothetical protein
MGGEIVLKYIDESVILQGQKVRDYSRSKMHNDGGVEQTQDPTENVPTHQS